MRRVCEAWKEMNRSCSCSWVVRSFFRRGWDRLRERASGSEGGGLEDESESWSKLAKGTGEGEGGGGLVLSTGTGGVGAT